MLKPERLRPGDKVAIVSLSRGSLGSPRSSTSTIWRRSAWSGTTASP